MVKYRMHILLTGPSQIGKTTIIQEIMDMAKINNWIVGGFSTYFGIQPSNWVKRLYLEDINLPKTYEDAHTAALFDYYSPVRVFLSRFDQDAVSLLKSQQKNAQLFLLDECSFLESKAFLFQKEILELFHGQTPVIAVARPDKATWLLPLLEQPDVKVYTLSLCNRDAIKKEVLEQIYSRMTRLP